MDNNASRAEIIGRRLKIKRKEFGMTRKQLATKIDGNIHTIRSWEYGDRSPRDENILALAKLFGCDSRYFLDPSFVESTAEYTDIASVTGLTSKSIDKLKELSSNEDKKLINFINFFIEHLDDAFES